MEILDIFLYFSVLSPKGLRLVQETDVSLLVQWLPVSGADYYVLTYHPRGHGSALKQVIFTFLIFHLWVFFWAEVSEYISQFGVWFYIEGLYYDGYLIFRHIWKRPDSILQILEFLRLFLFTLSCCIPQWCHFRTNNVSCVSLELQMEIKSST